MPRQRSPHLLIQTKLNRPEVGSNWVQRPRLMSRLNEGRQKRVTLISAPAGYGKTSLAVQWLAQSQRLSAWLSLDKNDNDLDRFLRYVIAAIQAVVSGFGSGIVPLLSSVQLPPPDYLADTMIRELSALKDRVALVLDDYQTLSSDAVHKFLTRMVEYLPDNLHLVILTRVDPPWPLGRWRGRQWLTELRAAHLAFTEEEIRIFLQEYGLTAEAIGILQKRIEGWVVGLQLARLSLAEAENPEEFVRRFSGSNRLIVDYLMDEVISHQPSEVLDFLAITEMLDRFCAPLCDALMTDEHRGRNSRQLIDHLGRENLFLVPLDGERIWYRYHHLFQNLLVTHLKDRMSSGRQILVYRRAAEWFAGQGLIEEALKYFLAAGDVNKAADLVELNLDETLDKDLSRRTLRRWLDMFPKAVEKKQPALLVARVYCKAQHWDFDGMIPLMDDAEAQLRNPACILPKSRRQTLLNHIDAERAFCLYWQGDVEGALRQGQRALNNTPKKYRHLLFLAVMYAGAAYALNGLRDKGLQLLSDATSKARSDGSWNAGAYLTVQAGILFYAGDLAAVKQTAEQILELYKTGAVNFFWFLHAHYFLGSAAYERNDLDAAAVHFQCVAEMRYRTNSRPYHDSLIGLALVALARGEVDKAREYAVSARSFAIEVSDVYSLKISDSFDTRLSIVSGGVLAGTAPRAPTVESNHLWLETPSLTHVESLLSRANQADCIAGLEYVENALKEVRQHHNTRQVIQLLAVKAVALKCSGKLNHALKVLEETLAMAEPLRFMRTFVDRGPVMAELLNALLERSPKNTYIHRLLDAFQDKIVSKAERAENESLSAGLTHRELDVLIMLAECLSNKEIAERLFISPDTVKRHSANIYRKLDVHSRQKAVAAASKHGLLPAK